MQYSKVLLFTLLSVATANPVDYSNEDLSIYARDADADSYDLAARDAFLDDEAEAKLAIREALFDNDDDFYTALAIRQQVKRSPTKNLEKLASKHAKSAFGMNRADVEKNNKKEKKAQIWSHQHQHQVTQADGKTKVCFVSRDYDCGH